jgi:hypothetical protein
LGIASASLTAKFTLNAAEPRFHRGMTVVLESGDDGVGGPGPGHNLVWRRDDSDRQLGGVGVDGLKGTIAGIPVLDSCRVDAGPEVVVRQKSKDRSDVGRFSYP